jgi:hypothetical protein
MLVPGRLRMSDSDAVVQQFVEMTGASVDLANFYLESAKGDLMRALDTFYESGGDAGAAPAPSAPGARGAGAPAAEGEEDDADEDDDDDDDTFPEPLAEEPSAGPGANAGPGRGGPMSLDEATRSMFEQAAQALACRAPPPPPLPFPLPLALLYARCSETSRWLHETPRSPDPCGALLLWEALT